MADEVVEIDVNVEVKSDILPTIAQLKDLKRQLKETSDPEEFARLQRQIDDTTEAIGAARVGAGNFFDVLGKLPGPIGFIGGQAAGLISSLKQFGQIKFSDLAQSFTELKNDFVDIAKGFGNLTGLTRVYTTVTSASAKALQFLGVSAQGAAAASRGLGIAISALLATTGLILLTGLIQAASAAWEYYSEKAERAEEQQKSLNESLLRGAQAALDAESKYVKRSGDLLLAQAKAKGASADKIYKIEQQNRELLLASQTRYYNELKNKDSKEAIDAVNAIKDTQNEIAIATANFQGDQVKRAADGARATQEELRRITEEDKKAFDDRMAEYQREMDEYYKRKKELQGVQIITQKQIRAEEAAEAEAAAKKQKEDDDKRIAEQMSTMSKITNFTLLAIQKQTDANKKGAEDQDKIGKWLNSEEKKRLDEKIQAVEATLQVVAGLIDQQSVAGKAVAVALTLIDTYQAATAAYKATVGIPVVGPTLAPIAAAAAIAAGLATVKKIVSTKIPSAKDAGGSVPGGGAASTSAPAFSQPTISAPQIGATANQQGQLAGIVAGALDRNNSEGRPIRAYVVGNDVTSEQQLQRRLRTAARLGG
jgi:hypothetical protein